MEIDEEFKLEFLVSGTYDALPSSYLKLRSYLNIHSSNLANLHGLKLPKCFTKTTLTCRQCFLPWSQGTSSIKLLPIKKLSKSFSKTKTDSTKAGSKLQIPRNHLVLKCNVCNNKSHFYLPKVMKTNKLIIRDEIKVQRKKKMQKKDNMRGLHKCLKTSFEKYEPSIKKLNKSESSTLKPVKAPSSTANITTNVQQKNLQGKNSQLCSTKVKQNIKYKNLSNNPCAAKLQHKSSKNKKKNLQKLQKIIQRDKEPVKKTLKDFLTLI